MIGDGTVNISMCQTMAVTMGIRKKCYQPSHLLPANGFGSDKVYRSRFRGEAVNERLNIAYTDQQRREIIVDSTL